MAITLKVEKGLKLSIPECVIYKRGRAWKTLHKNDSERLLNDEKFVVFMEKAIRIYNEKFPYRPKVPLNRRGVKIHQSEVDFTFESENPIQLMTRISKKTPKRYRRY
jgi:hypothetical protein